MGRAKKLRACGRSVAQRPRTVEGSALDGCERGRNLSNGGPGVRPGNFLGIHLAEEEFSYCFKDKKCFYVTPSSDDKKQGGKSHLFPRSSPAKTLNSVSAHSRASCRLHCRVFFNKEILSMHNLRIRAKSRASSQGSRPRRTPEVPKDRGRGHQRFPRIEAEEDTGGSRLESCRGNNFLRTIIHFEIKKTS